MPKATGLHLVGVRGDPLTSTLSLPTSWAEVGARTADPRTLRSIRLKYEIWPMGPNPKFDTDSRGLSPKAMGLHLEGAGGGNLGTTLVLPTSWDEVEGSNGGPQNFGFYSI